MFSGKVLHIYLSYTSTVQLKVLKKSKQQLFIVNTEAFPITYHEKGVGEDVRKGNRERRGWGRMSEKAIGREGGGGGCQKRQ